jgi:hypothetical protein
MVWIDAAANVLPVPADENHFTAVPKPIANLPLAIDGGRSSNPQALAEANKRGFYRGLLVNDRLYVLLNRPGNLPLDLMTKLRQYAKKQSLRRGVIVERE